MAKRFRMISPFDVVTGNVSGSQDLKYPTNNNKAYDAPAGKHYATNYKPRFIMHERKSDGLPYFALRQRSAINKTAKSTLAMAALGASGSIIGAILADKTSALYSALMSAYGVSGSGKTFRKFLSDEIYGGLKAKVNMFIWTYLSAGQFVSITLNNPYQSSGTGTYNVTISDDVLVKFWSELANNPFIFTVDGQKGIAHVGDKFSDVIASSYNVLGLSSKTVEGYEAVVIGDLYVNIADSEEYTASTGTSVDAAAEYKLSETFIDPS